MRLLVLGGTVFLSEAVATEAVRRGHEVVCACRGVSGAPPSGARMIRWDRSEPAPLELREAEYDAVVDVARIPSHVRRAVAALPEAHWVFVSSISVYADHRTPGGGPGRTPLLDPITDDLGPASSPEAYGGMKVACEQIVTAGTASAAVVRPGLIVGPDDPSGRFSYWPRRLARGGEVLAPGSPDAGVQVIDARDLAAWLVTLAERRTTGTFDGIGPVMRFASLLEACRAGVSCTWVEDAFLAEQGVEPWSGPDSRPLWLPRPEYDGMLTHDPEPGRAAGLATRPLAETSRDVLAWLEADPGAPVTGISGERESELLAAWHRRAH